MTKVKTFNQHLEEKYGKKGSQKRHEFEAKSKAFMIGELLKETRRSLKITQEELAEQLGISRQSIISVEKGKCLPSLPLALRLAEIFHQNLGIFFRHILILSALAPSRTEISGLGVRCSIP